MAGIGAKESLADVRFEGTGRGSLIPLTLKKFHEFYGPHLQLFFIIGMDVFEMKWKRYGELF
jgi:nicotinic acid mononucleotide adenylyltransferase